MNSVMGAPAIFRKWLTSVSSEALIASDFAFPDEYRGKPWLWMATSGTTSTLDFPKRWIAHTRESLSASAQSVCRWLAITEQDRWARILSRKHMGGLSLDARALISGCQIIDGAPDWEPHAVADWLTHVDATCLSAVPTQIWDWVSARVRAPTRLRAVIVGADRLDPALARQARDLGWPILASYGLTETASMIACDRLESLKTSNPNPTDGWLPLLDHAHASENPEGFLCLRSTSLFTAELNWHAELGRYAMSEPAIDPFTLAWPSSDRARVRDRNIQIVGRGDDLVKVNGVAIHLGELDRKLAVWLKERGISNPAVFGAQPDSRRGHCLEIFAEGQAPRDIDTQEPLLSSWNHSCAGLEIAARWHWIEKIPRTELGKIRRRLLSHST